MIQKSLDKDDQGIKLLKTVLREMSKNQQILLSDDKLILVYKEKNPKTTGLSVAAAV